MKKIISSAFLILPVFGTFSLVAVLTEWAVGHFAKVNGAASDEQVVKLAFITSVFWAMYHFIKSNKL